MIYGRRPRQLVVVWGSALLLIALIYWLETSAPALHELLVPFYYVVFFVVAFPHLALVSRPLAKESEETTGVTPTVEIRNNLNPP